VLISIEWSLLEEEEEELKRVSDVFFYFLSIETPYY
jgi:hypothetical protein